MKRSTVCTSAVGEVRVEENALSVTGYTVTFFYRNQMQQMCSLLEVLTLWMKMIKEHIRVVYSPLLKQQIPIAYHQKNGQKVLHFGM